MKNNLFSGSVRFEHVPGVGTIEVDFKSDQRVYTLIGENGVGKTKLLECLFVSLLLVNQYAKNYKCWITEEYLPFKKTHTNYLTMNSMDMKNRKQKYDSDLYQFLYPEDIQSLSTNFIQIPLVYLAAQERGSIKSKLDNIEKIGSTKDRLQKYLERIFNSLMYGNSSLTNLNMDTNIEEWIIQRAQSANPYQAKEDNRKIELDTLLFLLNQIDNRIDADFLEISGSNRVFIKIENQKRELSDLSSGFTSILKIIQSIIAGYSYFTNEVQISHVPGIVLIDEIESHLHNEWQVRIIPLLKKLFPNTIFFITTHSSLVISQLGHGEAYRLERNQEDGIVYGKLIDYPSNSSLVDLLNDAFGVNLNKLKLKRIEEQTQEQAKQALLELVMREIGGK